MQCHGFTSPSVKKAGDNNSYEVRAEGLFFEMGWGREMTDFFLCRLKNIHIGSTNSLKADSRDHLCLLCFPFPCFVQLFVELSPSIRKIAE